MASVNDRHPEYTAERVAEWELMRDVFTGESAIKSKGEIYLPMPSGFTALPDKGAKAYASYKARAQVAEMLAPTIAGMMGIAHGVEIKIELPAGLEYLWENADGKGTPLEALHRRITRNLLLSGRYGLLADAPEAGGDPRLAGYAAETIINWDSELFVLDESGKTRVGFAWSDVKRFRVLNIVDGRYWQDVYETDLASPARSIVPAARGGKAMDRVPFAVASSVDLDPAIRTPPLIGVARSVIANYQLSADYRHQLYMSGQETLVVINGEAPEAVGAGACIAIQGAEGVTPDVKYVSPTCSGKHPELFKVNEAGDAGQMLRNRIQRQLHGFTMGYSAGVKRHTPGAAAGRLVNNGAGYAPGATSIAFDTGSGAFVAGDLVSFDTGTEKYVARATGATPLIINAHGLKDAVADNAPINVSPAYTANMFFHRSALLLAARAPAMPEGGDSADDVTTVQDPVSGLTFQVALYRQYRQVKFEVGLAWGVAAPNGKHGGILLG